MPEDDKVIRNTRARRIGAVILVASGATLMFLAPDIWQGALLLCLGVVLELIGIALERKSR